jgi:hypothetical protein
MPEGFQLRIGEIADNLVEDVSQRGWTGVLRIYTDSYKHPDKAGVAWVHTPVDLAVVTFVGTREQAAAVARAAEEALG